MKLLRIAASTLLASGLIAGSAVLPASADNRGTIDYVALGDSYAAGVGAGPYLNACAQSLLGYPALLDERKQINLTANATCSGATVRDVALTVGSAGADTDLVTLTVGGNDVNYIGVIFACGQGAAACEGAVGATVTGVLPLLAAQLDALYDSINAQSPNAEVVVTGYPHLFSPEFGTTIALPALNPATGQPFVLTPTEQQILNEGTDALNGVIRAEALEAGFTYVDVVQRFDKHGLGSPQPWIQPFTDVAALHPTAKGYKSGYLHEIRNALN